MLRRLMVSHRRAVFEALKTMHGVYTDSNLTQINVHVTVVFAGLGGTLDKVALAEIINLCVYSNDF